MARARDLRSVVLGRASFRCESCHIDGWELQVEHVVPRSPRHRAVSSLSADELNALANLAAACAHCNASTPARVPQTRRARRRESLAVSTQPGLWSVDDGAPRRLDARRWVSLTDAPASLRNL